MHRRSRTPLVPASILNRMSDSRSCQSSQQDAVPSGDHYDWLLQENISLAKENARLKNSYRELMERKLKLEASHAARMISAPAVSDAQLEKKQIIMNVKDKFAEIGDEISQAQTMLSKLVHVYPVHSEAVCPEETTSRDQNPISDNRVHSEWRPQTVVETKKKAVPEMRTVAELQSKENVDPVTMTETLTMAPKKKMRLSKTGLTGRTGAVRIGNMIVKRNTWNLAFESIRPAFRQQTRPDIRVTSGKSVYDFD